MISGIKDYVNEWEEELNFDLINKTADKPLVDYIIDCWKSLEVVKQIKFIGYEYTEEESSIDINKHIYKRDKKKKKKEKYDIKFIDDDRVGRLTVHMEIRMLITNPTTGETSYQIYPIKKSLLIPLQDENGCFTIKSKKYYMIYQLLEKSTYVSASSITLKSLMPIAVKRHVVEAEDIYGNTYQLPCYYVFVFKKEIPILLFYLSKGIAFTLEYLNIFNIVDFIEGIPEIEEVDDKYMYFPLSSKCTLRVLKRQFTDYPFIQSIVGAFKTVCTNRVTVDMLDDTTQWIKRIVTPNNYEKGLGIVKYFGRMLDDTTKKVLKLPNYYKSDMFAILKWMMQHFNTLRLKDNCDLSKRLLLSINLFNCWELLLI